MIGEDAGSTFDITRRFQQKSIIGYEVEYTIKSDLCENARAAGAVEDELVATLVDSGLMRVDEILNSGSRPKEGVQDLLKLELGLLQLGEYQQEAMSSVIVRLAGIK